jgi:glycosyltransferase involved in cell wall biosynthesis
MAEDERLELHLFLLADQHDLFMPIDNRIRIHTLNFRPGFWYLLFWEQLVLPIVARRLGADVTFSSANYGPLLAPAPVIVLSNAVAVGTTEVRLSRRIYWRTLALVTAISLVTCRRAIAVSDYARDALSFGLGRWLDGKIKVVHHGVSTHFSPGKSTPDTEPYLLAVGDIYIQKNLHTLVEALAIIQRRSPGIRLKIAGRRTDPFYYDKIVRLIAQRGLADSIDLLGQRSLDELRELYRDCAVFVFPSTVETFGMPLVEAMACGAPIVCSNTAAMPEIVGECAVLCDPMDAEDMANKILHVIEDEGLAQRLIDLGRQRSKFFSWDKAARLTADVLVEAAQNRPGHSGQRKDSKKTNIAETR